MFDRAIIVGVDDSNESAKAAALGWRLAADAGTTCHLVHAVHDTWTSTVDDIPFDLTEYNRRTADAHRHSVQEALRRHLPDDAFDRLHVRLGRPARVIRDLVHDLDAGLVLMGGKHHGALERWLSGSTVHQVLRISDVPMLVTGSGETNFTRVLAAVDLSYAAVPTIKAAEAFADWFDATLWVMHVVDTVGTTSMVPLPLARDELVDQSTRRLEAEVWPAIERARTETVVREGRAADAIIQEVAAWHAGLVVLGSHGKGFTERILLGSTTERLLNNLPAALLVMPVRHS